MRRPDLTQSKKRLAEAHRDLGIGFLTPSELFAYTYTLDGAIYRRDLVSDLIENRVFRAHYSKARQGFSRWVVYNIDTVDNWGTRIPLRQLQHRVAVVQKWVDLPITLEYLAELPGASQGARELRSFAKRARKSLDDYAPVAEKLRKKPLMKINADSGEDLEDIEGEIDISWAQHCLATITPFMERLRFINKIGKQMEEYLLLCKPYEQRYDGKMIPSCKPEFLDQGRREGKILNAYHPLYFSHTVERQGRKNINLITSLNVPNDIHWGNAARNTFVQGPNSMGKSVYLETIALNVHLPMAGLRCFAEHAELSPVPTIFPCFDMGASMEEGHFGTGARKVRYMLENVTRDDLVLLDEVGGGTEPEAEREIARGISDALIKYGITTFNTTHDRTAWAKHKKEPGVAFLRVADLQDEKRKYRVWPGIAKSGYGMEKAQELKVDPQSADEAIGERILPPQ